MEYERMVLLNEEFEAARVKINGKLEGAALLIREANALASAVGKTLQEDDYDNEETGKMFRIDTLDSAMEDAGWNTSGWYC